MQLDRVAKEIVLENLQEAIPSQRPAMVRELRALIDSETRTQTAHHTAAVSEEAGLELAGRLQERQLVGPAARGRRGDACAGPEEDRLGKAVHRLLHIDDPDSSSAPIANGCDGAALIHD